MTGNFKAAGKACFQKWRWGHPHWLGFVCAILATLIVATVADAQSDGIVANILKPRLEKAVRAAAPTITDPQPFADAVVDYVDGNGQEALYLFLKGLAVNTIASVDVAQKLLAAVAPVGNDCSFELSLAAQSGVARQVEQFPQYVSEALAYATWSKAIGAGDTVSFTNNQLVIVPKQQAENSENGAVVFAATLPEGASVRIDGAESAGLTVSDLAAGDHTYEIEGPSVRATSEAFSVVPGCTVFLLPKLVYRTGTLVVKDLPWGAVLALDNKPLNTAGWSGSQELPVGEHSLVISDPLHPSAAPFQTTLHLVEGQSTTVDVPEGHIAITNAPSGVHVFLADSEITQTLVVGKDRSLLTPALAPEDYAIRIAGDFVDDTSYTVSVTTGATSTVTADLAPRGIAVVNAITIPLYGEAILRFRDSLGKVIREGKVQNSHTEIKLPDGDYTVELQYRNDIDVGYRGSISVVAGERTAPLSVALDYSKAFIEKKIKKQKDETAAAYGKNARVPKILDLSALLGGIGTSALAGTAYYLGSQDYGQYQAATTSSDATSARNQAQMWSEIFTVSAVAGGALLAATSVIYFALVRPAASDEGDALKTFDEQLQRLQKQDQGNAQVISFNN